MDQLLNVEEVKKILGMSTSGVQNLFRTGKLVSMRKNVNKGPGNGWVTNMDEILKLIEKEPKYRSKCTIQFEIVQEEPRNVKLIKKIEQMQLIILQMYDALDDIKSELE